MTNTEELDAVAQEFVMSKYASQQALREAMLQEIVILLAENEHLRKKIDRMCDILSQVED